MQEEGEQLARCKVQTGGAELELSIEMLGEEPEEMGAFQTQPIDGIRDAMEV